MPPKMKKVKLHTCDPKTCKDSCKNPRVILRPLLADHSGQSRYHFSNLPPSASLFNKADFSDIKLKVGDTHYYSHRLLLCAASEVFARMLGPNSEWVEGRNKELVLQEDEECIKVFDRFLYYIYSGTVLLSDSCVLPLFLLSDKYNVKALYQECVKVIERGLKVYTVKGFKQGFSKPPEIPSPTFPKFLASSSSSSSSGTSSSSDESEDENDQGNGNHGNPQPAEANASGVSNLDMPSTSSASPTKMMSPNQKSPKRTDLHLVASETFPLNMVMKMLTYCNNEQISKAALYNLEARLINQIYSENYGLWNDLDTNLLVSMLKDEHFYCRENVILKAVISWLEYDKSRQEDNVLEKTLCNVRYGILNPQQLYHAEKESMLNLCEPAQSLLKEAIAFKLFKKWDWCVEDSDGRWKGAQFTRRSVKHE